MVDILIADDHPIVRDAVRRVVESVPGWSVVATADTSSGAIRILSTTPVHVAIVDLDLPQAGGLEVIRMAAIEHPTVRFVALTMHGKPETVRSAFGQGARAYVLKADPGSDIVDAIRSVLRGERYVSTSIEKSLSQPVGPTGSERESTRPLDRLSARESEVLALVGAGLSTPEIADHLFLSRRTIDTHRANIMKKLGLSRAAELVRFAVSENLVIPPPHEPPSRPDEHGGRR